MCGIAGIMTAENAPPVDFAELCTMIAMLEHRGPDGYGLYRDARIGLAHARLSIIDLASGDQPLSTPDGKIWLSFNGEIFNYIELRQQLMALGHRFSTTSDSEVILHCYQRYGERAWAMLNGQFAFAVWDTRAQKLWLVRDRFGILPLHYAVVDGHVVFASEAKALFAGGRIAPAFDPQGLGEIFTTWAAMAPRTAFAGVRQVRPGSALCFDTRLEPTEQRYWQMRPGNYTGGREAADQLESHLKNAVDLRLRADVPVGAYLSGGLDSSVIGSLATRATPNIQSFGIRFEDPRFDETSEQRAVIRHLKTAHHEIYCTAGDIRAALAETVWHCETPLLRTSPVPMFLLSAAVKAAEIKCVLTGEGADELLCGYSIFKEDQIRRFWARDPQSRMRPALLSRIHHYVGGADAHNNTLWQRFFRTGLTDTDHPFYSHLIRWNNTGWTRRILSPDMQAGLPFDQMLQEFESTLPEDWLVWDPLLRAQYLEIQSFMSSYLLPCQGDRVAMAHGVEARYPFLDPDLVEFCCTLKTSDKQMGTADKLALRRVAKRYLPPEIAGRRKQPFRAPIGSALYTSDVEAFGAYLTPAALEKAGCFDVKVVEQLLARMRRRGGDQIGEREEMAFVGVLTLAILADAFGPGFGDKTREATARLARIPCRVLVDRLHGASEHAPTPFAGREEYSYV